MKLLLVFLALFGNLVKASTQEKPFIVAADGSGDFKTVQEAVNAVPDFRKKTTTIFIKKGVYKEKLIVPPTKTMVKLVGEDVNSTIITFDDYASKKNRFGEEIGTSGSSSCFIHGADFSAENITFENSSGPVGQAVAAWVGSDRASFKNCRFLGFQDTLYTYGTGKQYYKNCYIEGTTDFIFGSATAVFDSCDIFCKKGGHYITAASTPQHQPYGYVFLNCRIKGDAPDHSFHLGRPWRPYAKTVFIHCDLPSLITPPGWDNWRNEANEKTAFYAEYNNYGKGADSSKRVKWSHQLTEEEAKTYTLKNILGF